MIGRAFLAAAVSASIAAGVLAASPVSAAPLGSAVLSEVVGPQAEMTSFWGRPYPYGYAYSRSQCWRRVQVETRHGWHWKRIWVCHR